MHLDHENFKQLMRELKEHIRLGGDCLIFVCGKTGAGKSRFIGMNILDYWYRGELGKDEIPEYAITGDIADYMQSIDKADMYDAVVCDEASDQFSTDSRNDPASVALYHMYQQTREKGLLHILIMPSFFDLIPALRDGDLIKFVVYAHGRYPNECKKCKYTFVQKSCPNCGSTEFKSGYCSYKVYDQVALDKIRENARSKKTKRFENAAFGINPLFKGKIQPYTGQMMQYYDSIKATKMAASKERAKIMVKNAKKKESNRFRCIECGSLDVTHLRKEDKQRCKRCGKVWPARNNE